MKMGRRFKIQNVSACVLYVILATIFVVLCFFFFGGETSVEQRLVADTSIPEPAQTDVLIYLIYALLATTLLVTVISIIYHFGQSFADSPRTALKTLTGVAVLIALMAVSWFMGSDKPLIIPGYDGSENVSFWLKIADMFLYTIYIQLAAIILLILGFGINKKIKNII